MNQYIMMTRIAQAALDTEGAIFGGYVRDKIIHDNGARKFYRQNPDATKEQYNDREFHPESVDRLLMPEDIDVLFEKPGMLDTFVKVVLRRYPILKVRTKRRPFPYVEEGGQRVTMYKLVFSAKPLKDFIKTSCPFPVVLDGVNDTPTLSVNVDVVVTDQAVHAGLDYECNGLIMRRDSITASHGLPGDQASNLVRIISDIEQRIAVEVIFSGRRFTKMVNRPGWQILGGLIERPLNREGDCLLCLSSVTKGEALKLSCCSALYHPKCLETSLNTEHTGVLDKGRCFHCRRPVELGVSREAGVVGPF
jgi:hypothetical protein